MGDYNLMRRRDLDSGILNTEQGKYFEEYAELLLYRNKYVGGSDRRADGEM